MNGSDLQLVDPITGRASTLSQSVAETVAGRKRFFAAFAATVATMIVSCIIHCGLVDSRVAYNTSISLVFVTFVG